jgi:hypothetical protein
MGHRAYLIIRAEAGEMELFEANNALPFFWLTLLDEAALAHAAPAWDYASRLWMLDPLEQDSYTDTWPRPTNLVLEKAALTANIAKAHRLLQACYPALLAAYQEFTHYLLAQLPGPTDQLQLDVFALADFTSPAELLQSLREQIAALDRQQPEKLGHPGLELTQLVGFPVGVTAPAADYPQLQALRASPRPAPLAVAPKPTQRSAQLLAAGLLLLYLSWRGYQREGLTGLVAGLALLGGVATAWAIARLRALLRRQ